MEVGPVFNKVGAIIQARMSSERLPGKVLMDLPIGSGKPLLTWIIDALRSSSLCQSIIVATSNSPADEPIFELCKSLGVKVFRGSESDVLSRFQAVAIEEKLDTIVRITGDNPIVDVALLDSIIKEHILHGNDYTRTTGLPIGMNFEVIDAAIVQYEGEQLSQEDREHVTLKAKKLEGLKKKVVNLAQPFEIEKLRLTVDYPIDYLMMSELFRFIQTESLPDMHLINSTLQDYPWLFSVNANVYQKKQFNSLQDELDTAISMLREFEMKRSARILERYEK